MELTQFLQALIEHLPNLFIGLGIVLGFYWLSNIKSFFLWIKGGIEDGDGKLENKELQIAFFSLLAAFEVITIALHAAEFPDTVIYATFGLAGLAYTANRWSATQTHDDHKPSSKPKPQAKPQPPAPGTENVEDDDSNYI